MRIPNDMPIVQARHDQAKVDRVMGLNKSYRFRIAALLACDNRPGRMIANKGQPITAEY